MNDCLVARTVEMRLLDTLRYGRAKALTSRKLGHMLNIEPRRVRRVIAELIDQGYLIGSSPMFGFFMIQDEIDAKITLQHFKPRVTAIYSRLKKLEGGIREKFQGQLQITPTRYRFNRDIFASNPTCARNYNLNPSIRAWVDEIHLKEVSGGWRVDGYQVAPEWCEEVPNEAL